MRDISTSQTMAILDQERLFDLVRWSAEGNGNSVAGRLRRCKNIRRLRHSSSIGTQNVKRIDELVNGITIRLSSQPCLLLLLLLGMPRPMAVDGISDLWCEEQWFTFPLCGSGSPQIMLILAHFGRCVT